MICVDIDKLTPCLERVSTGEIVDTEVIRIKRKSFLERYNKKNGWYTSWKELSKENEIYALVVRGTVSIQGLIAIRNDPEMKAAYVSWMVAAPTSNPQIVEEKEYYGIGGHLFAIAAAKSEEYGYDCEFTGVAANKDLMEHYVSEYGAIPIGILGDYHIVIEATEGHRIKEVYTCEWTDDEL